MLSEHLWEGLGNGKFLGLEEVENGPFDLVILPIPLEMTVSWMEGTSNGPSACIEASSQVELFDPILNSEIPCGLSFHTAKEWTSEESTLRKQLDSIQEYVRPWFDGRQFESANLGGTASLRTLCPAGRDAGAQFGWLSKIAHETAVLG